MPHVEQILAGREHLPRKTVSFGALICPQMIIHQAHSGKELCRHIAKPLTMMTTQSPHQKASIQLKMMERGMAIKPLKTT
jgi:hypothetical protein